MAVGANTYGTVVRVETLVGDLVPSRDFTTSTIPTEAQVEQALDDVAAEINVELEWAGYTVPVASSTNATAHAYLVAANSAGAAARVMTMVPGLGFSEFGDTESPATTRRQSLQQQLDRCIKRIREHRLVAAGVGRLDDFRVGGEKDQDGNTKLPIFRRGLHRRPNEITLSSTSPSTEDQT